MISTINDPLDLVEPVSLAEMVTEADFQARVDRKYVIPTHQLPALLTQVPVGTRVLEIDGRRQFHYRSCYFDTPDRLSYLTSGRSHRGRWKVRSRSYLDTGSDWLEIKTAGPRGRTRKERTLLTSAAERGLSASNTDFLAGTVGMDVACSLQPVLVTLYRRSTLLLPGFSARVTIDVDVTWTSVSGHQELHSDALAIVETKTGSTPTALDRLLWSYGHRPVRISKYGVGMAALHPDLPRLKWRRALDRHLHLPFIELPRSTS